MSNAEVLQRALSRCSIISRKSAKNGESSARSFAKLDGMGSASFALNKEEGTNAK